MENIILTAATVVEAFIVVEADAAIAKEFNKNKKESADNAVASFKKFIAQEQGNKPAFMLPNTLATVIASIEAGFVEKGLTQPGAYRTTKNAIVAYVREGFTDLSLGRDAMRKAAKIAEEARIHGVEKERQRQVDAYLAEQEAARLAEQEAEAAQAAAEKEAKAIEAAARVAILWKNLQDACQSKAAQAAFAELTTALSISL